MIKEIQGVQMIGTQRSGSNLLRVMLDALEEVTAPHPPHILQRFLPLLPLYGDLCQDENFRQLTVDVCALVTLNPVLWDGIQLDAEAIRNQCASPSLFELFRVIYDTAALQTGARFWVCKSMKNVFYADQIEATGVKPLYIYLYRDGRDVALSFKKAIVGEKHIYPIAQNWKKDQEEALRLRDRIEPSRFHEINYEEMLVDPAAVMQRICRFLDTPYSNNVLEYYKSKESIHTAIAGQMWSNVTKPILKENTKKFLKELTSQEITIFESVAGHTLTTLGYDLCTPLENRCASFTHTEIEVFNTENIRLKEVFLNQAAIEDIQKRKPQSDLISQIKNRTI